MKPGNKSNLGDREYLTPAQAVQIFGRSTTYWRNLFDSKRVDGYRSGRWRWLKASSIRTHLENLAVNQQPNWRDIVKNWRSE